MPCPLSVARDFLFGDESIPLDDIPPTLRPTSVYQALKSIEPEDWDALAREIFGVEPDSLDVETVLARVLLTNLCRSLDPPVEVFIDSDGFHTILVY